MIVKDLLKNSRDKKRVHYALKKVKSEFLLPLLINKRKILLKKQKEKLHTADKLHFISSSASVHPNLFKS